MTAQLNGVSQTVWWALYLACYLTGGWDSAWAGRRRCAIRPSTWTC